MGFDDNGQGLHSASADADDDRLHEEPLGPSVLLHQHRNSFSQSEKKGREVYVEEDPYGDDEVNADDMFSSSEAQAGRSSRRSVLMSLRPGVDVPLQTIAMSSHDTHTPEHLAPSDEEIKLMLSKGPMEREMTRRIPSAVE